MILKELFDNQTASSGTNGTVPTSGTKKPKTAQEMQAERQQKKKEAADKQKNAMKARAFKNGMRPGQKTDQSDSDEVVDDD